MSIGTTLAEARRGAGLTVGQVSDKTRIRATIIRGIEGDDYSACGGDFYARGHIRAIARVVGADSAPLIEEYDTTLKAPEEITAAEAFRPAMPVGKRGHDQEPEHVSHPPEPAAKRGQDRRATRQHPPASDREPPRRRGPSADQGSADGGQPVHERGPAGPRESFWSRGSLWRRGPDKDAVPDAGVGLVTDLPVTSPPVTDSPVTDSPVTEPVSASAATPATEPVPASAATSAAQEAEPVSEVASATVIDLADDATPVTGWEPVTDPRAVAPDVDTVPPPEPASAPSEPDTVDISVPPEPDAVPPGSAAELEPAPVTEPAPSDTELLPLGEPVTAADVAPVGDLMPADKVRLFAASGRDRLTAGRDRLTAARDRLAVRRDRLTDGSEPVADGSEPTTAGRDRFTAGRDRFTAGRDRLAAGGGRMLAGGQRFMASRPELMARGQRLTARGQRLTAGRQRLNWTYVLALILLVVVGVLGFLLVDSSGHAPSSTQAASGSRHPGRVSGRGRPNPGPTAARTTPAGSATPGLPLSPVSATAFGPGGAGQGDNPQLAPLVIGGGAWHTDWYSTATFGNIQAGTGLLLDMGRPVTITAAQMTLGGSPGASLQLRAGNTPTLANLSQVAGASNAGGALQLNFSKPVTCRYVLIWFTGLPPDPAGTFQASVSNVRLKGTA